MNSSPRPVTLEDVAREAGVSRATASRAINGGIRTVSEGSRSRVLAVAERLGYSTNIAAQAVVRGRTNSVAFVVNVIADDYFSPISAGVYKAADRLDMMVTMVSTRASIKREVSILAALRGQRPQTIIVAGGRSDEDELELPRMIEQLSRYEAEGGRAVLITQLGLPFDTVTADNERAGRDLVNDMWELGYREFSVLAGSASSSTPRDRLSGIRGALLEHGVELTGDRIIHSGFGRDDGYLAAGELLRRGLPAQLLLATSDALAVGAIARFREAGLRMPGDIAIAGFDDIVALRDISPSLTTVRLPWNEIGEQALMLGLSPREGPPRQIVIPGHVVRRESTPPVG